MSMQFGIRPCVWEKLKGSTDKAHAIYAHMMEILSHETVEESLIVMHTLQVMIQASIVVERQCEKAGSLLEHSAEVQALINPHDAQREEAQP
jgi:hypothetical protein